MRLSWTYRHRLAALSGVILALHGAGFTHAQFAPISNPSQIAGQQPAANGQTQGYGQTQAYSQPQVFGQVSNNVQAQPSAYTPTTSQVYGQTQAYRQPQAKPQYTAMAYLGNEAGASQQPAGNVGANVAAGAPGCNCQPAPAATYPQAAPATTYSGYGGCATGSGGYNTFSGGSSVGTYTGGYGAGSGGCASPRNCGRRWFGGFYGLLMERNRGDKVPLGFTTVTPGVGYYPTDVEVTLTTQSVDTDFQGGIEARFGSTFGRGNACGCGPELGWELAYWGLQEETATARLDDVATFGTDGNRTYSMIDFRGLEANMGAGYRPVNSYFDYAPPAADHTGDPGFAGVDVEIRSLVARSTFSTQNLELNLLRLPMFGGGSTVGSSGCAGGGCASGGCAGGSCGYGASSCGYGGGRAPGGYAYCGPRHSLTTLMGVRYMRFDDDFSLRSNFDTVVGGAVTGSGFIAYNAEADNHLVGFQLGCNGIYRLGCQGRWALHYGSSFGVYGNHMEMSQRMDVPTGGNVRFVNGTQANFDVDSSKDEVAFLGELRVGGSYQYSCNWRFYGGWRALGVSGVALSTSQIPTAFITPGQVGYINSNDSLILHGLQAGVEYTY